MKKIFSILVFTILLATVSLISSCGGSDREGDGKEKVSDAVVERIIDKYDEGETLTKNDYKKLIAYLENAVDEALPLMKKASAASESRDKEAYRKLMDKIKRIEDKYSFMNQVYRIVDNADSDEMGTSNKKKVERMFEKMRGI